MNEIYPGQTAPSGLEQPGMPDPADDRAPAAAIANTKTCPQALSVTAQPGQQCPYASVASSAARMNGGTASR